MYRVQTWFWAVASIACSDLFSPSAAECLAAKHSSWSDENAPVCKPDAKSKLGAVLLGTRKDIQRSVATPKEANHSITHHEVIHKNSSCWLAGGPGGIGCWLTWLTSRETSTSTANPIKASTEKVPETAIETERAVYTWCVRILFTLKTKGGAWLWKCLLTMRAKLNEPMCRLLLVGVTLVCACMWCAMKSYASRQRRSRLRQAKSQLDDDALGYLFKARQLEQARLQAQAQRKGSPSATSRSNGFISWSK